MEKENFREIKQSHFEICENILAEKICDHIKCASCPFSCQNAINSKYCFQNGYFFNLENLLRSCKEFLKYKKKGDK